MPTEARGGDAFLAKRVDELPKLAQGDGFGNLVGADVPVVEAEEPAAWAPVGPISEIGGGPSPISGAVVGAEHPSKCAKKNYDAPRVGPPEKGDPIPQDPPGLVTAESPCIFQTGAGDSHSHRPIGNPFSHRERHIVLHEDGRAMGDNRFRYWAFYTNGRFAAVRRRAAFFKQAPCAADMDLNAPAATDKKSIVRKMVAFAGPIPSTTGESYTARRNIERMADQVEWEASLKGDNEGIGRVQALFTTLTAPLCKWRRLNRITRKWLGGQKPSRANRQQRNAKGSPQKKTMRPK